MPFAYRAEQIAEIVNRRKVPRLATFLKSGESIPFQEVGEKGRRIDVLLDLVDGPLVDLKLQVRGPVFDNPETYEGVLLLSAQRIRGIGWNPISRRRFYKERIPKGWHENLIDPNRDFNDPEYNRHLPLPEFNVVDLTDFFMKAARYWNIELNLEEELW
jgi:hypothetical protein